MSTSSTSREIDYLLSMLLDFDIFSNFRDLISSSVRLDFKLKVILKYTLEKSFCSPLSHWSYHCSYEGSFGAYSHITGTLTFASFYHSGILGAVVSTFLSLLRSLSAPLLSLISLLFPIKLHDQCHLHLNQVNRIGVGSTSHLVIVECVPWLSIIKPIIHIGHVRRGKSLIPISGFGTPSPLVW
jgi:hypothetical protein